MALHQQLCVQAIHRSCWLHRTAEAKAAKAEAEALAEAAAAEREQLADLQASNSRLEKHVEVRVVWCPSDM